MKKLHISISAETLFHLGPVPISNSMLTSLIISTILIALVIRQSRKLTFVPSIGQSLFELPVEGIYSLCRSVAAHKAILFFPFVATFFIFILISNWSGLIPGVGTIGLREHNGLLPIFRAPTADLNTNIALAVISVGLLQYYGIKNLGLAYLKRFFNFKNPLNTFVGLLELVLELARVVSFAFRLFGNIFAGEVLLTVTAFLLPILIPVPFYGLELFVGMIQALVFSMLTLVFLHLATTPVEH